MKLDNMQLGEHHSKISKDKFSISKIVWKIIKDNMKLIEHNVQLQVSEDN